jgi:hypothetical protein
MRKLFFLFGIAALLLCTTAAAQSDSEATFTKAVLSGKVSADGATLIGDSGTWFVSNPASLAGREGRIVRVKCRRYAANKILVLSVKLAEAETRYVVNHGDSAFRR